MNMMIMTTTQGISVRVALIPVYMDVDPGASTLHTHAWLVLGWRDTRSSQAQLQPARFLYLCIFGCLGCRFSMMSLQRLNSSEGYFLGGISQSSFMLLHLLESNPGVVAFIVM